jgi:hypothetical protein
VAVTNRGETDAAVRAFLAEYGAASPFLRLSEEPAPGPPLARAPSGLILPAHAVATPLKYVGTYVTLNEYASDHAASIGVSTEDLIAFFIGGQYSRADLVVTLALLNHYVVSGGHAPAFAEYVMSALSGPLAEGLRRLLDGGRPPQALVARQPLLAAMKTILVAGRDKTVDPPPKAPADIHAVLAIHGIASLLGADYATGASEAIPGVPIPLFMELIRLGPLYEGDDLYASIDRHVRWWLQFGSALQRVTLRGSPDELLREAIGLGVEDALALGFGVMAWAMGWEPSKPPFVKPEFGDVDQATVEAFVSFISDDLNGFRTRFQGRDEPFDFLAFQETPVLRTATGLLAVDQGFLWHRVTQGLYWVVHDHEKEVGGDAGRDAWAAAYGEMVEAAVEASVAAMAIPDLRGGKTFFTEDDFRSAYAGKTPDAGLDFGASLVLFEVVSGQLHTGTRIAGDFGQFERDTERLVLAKCRQLDDAASSFLANPAALTGAAVNDVRVVPVVVAAAGYPANPFVARYISDRLEAEGLLQHRRVEPICVLDMADIEILEVLAEEGRDASEVLVTWKHSALADSSFRNFVIEEFGGDRSYRPRRMHEIVDGAFAAVLARYGFSPRRPS